MLKRINNFFFHKSESNTKLNLKKNGRKIKVEIEKCIIKPVQHWEKKEEKGALEIKMLDALSGREAIKDVQVNGCYIIYEYELQGDTKKKLVSPFINKDHVTLSFLLQGQKEIFIYMNPDNSDEYYFDLEFLN